MPFKDPEAQRAYFKAIDAKRSGDQKRKARRRETNRLWYATNKERKNATRKAWRARNPERELNQALSGHYGITADEYRNMLARQNGVCKICDGENNCKRLWVDHCHTTNKIRGLLCASCNTGIGNLQDSPALLRKAADYIEQHEGKA